jgi:hypothetical protein
MKRLFGRKGQLRIRSLALCFCLTVTSLIVRVAAEQESPLGGSSLLAEVQPTSETSLIADRLLTKNESDGATNSVELLPQHPGQVWHEIYHRVFQLGAEERRWPELKFGWRTVTAFLLGGVGAALSSAGGIGGGGLFVPLFNLLLEFDAKTSAALSNFMILGGSLANLYINVRQHHPTIPHKPLIDFDVVSLLQPNMLLGISIGVILNVVLPDWIVTALLTLTLSYISIRSYKGALCRWKKESKQNCLQRKSPGDVQQEQDSSNAGFIASQDDCKSSIITDDKGDEENLKTSTNCSGLEGSLSEPLLLPDESCRRSFLPKDKLLALGVTWIAFFAIQVLRGGKGSQVNCNKQLLALLLTFFRMSSLGI